MNNSLLIADKVVREFKETGETLRVLDEIDLTVAEGDFLCITGESGAGKSTLLQILGSLDTPTAGDVLFKNESLFSMSAAKINEFRLRELGFVFQFHHLLPELTALENVLLPSKFLRGSKKANRDRAEFLLNIVGLKDRQQHLPNEMSGGERQRAAIARALMNEPSLLLADEPTGNLDEKNSFVLLELFQKLNEELNQTTIVVTHDLHLAKQGKRRLHMKAGRFIEFFQE